MLLPAATDRRLEYVKSLAFFTATTITGTPLNVTLEHTLPVLLTFYGFIPSMAVTLSVKFVTSGSLIP